MEVRYQIKIAICPNDKCKSPIRLSEGRFVGGVNDKGGIIIECDACKKVFPCRLTNPNDASGIIKNGKQLDSWTEEMPEYIEIKYGLSSQILDAIETSLVFDYEKPPKPIWQPSESPLFETNGINYEAIAKQELDKNKQIITDNYNVYFNAYIKGPSSDKSFVILNYDYQGTKHKAVFAKQIDSESDLNIENLYLIYHSGINLEYQVDGIYTRDTLLVFLERFLNRWRYSANEVLLVVPFIGFNYKN